MKPDRKPALAAGVPAAVDDAWDPREVRRYAREFARLAAAELLRESGPVRPPDSLRLTKKLLGRTIAPADAVALVREIAEASLHINHPRFIAQQVAAPIPLAALVETVVAALNQSIAVWEMSPAGTLIDRDLMSRFKKLFRYPATAEGTMTPGGAFANLTALVAARNALEPNAWKQGGARVAFVAGAHTHYSVSRSAGILGCGMDSVFSVPTDSLHRTDASRVAAALREARRAGFRKAILVGTAGSTSTGSFDELDELARIASAEGAWFHVDAAHGGGLAFSKRYRRLLRGIERADSLAFDPHKMLFMPLASSAVLVRDGRLLQTAFEQEAPYLFGQAAQHRPEVGPMTIACSQRFDALKVWLTWKAYSGAIWDRLITHVCAMARVAYDYCAESEVLEPAHEPQSNILCFRLRHVPDDAQAADAQNLSLKEAVNASGYAYLSSTILAGRRVLRMVVMNPRTSADDVRAVLSHAEALARKAGRKTRRTR